MQTNEAVKEDYMKIMNGATDTVDLFLSENNKATVTLSPNTIEFRMPNVDGLFEDDSFMIVQEYNPMAFGTAYMFLISERNKISVLRDPKELFHVTYLVDRVFYLQVKDVFSCLIK